MRETNIFISDNFAEKYAIKEIYLVLCLSAQKNLNLLETSFPVSL